MKTFQHEFSNISPSYSHLTCEYLNKNIFVFRNILQEWLGVSCLITFTVSLALMRFRERKIVCTRDTEKDPESCEIKFLTTVIDNCSHSSQIVCIYLHKSIQRLLTSRTDATFDLVTVSFPLPCSYISFPAKLKNSDYWSKSQWFNSGWKNLNC